MVWNAVLFSYSVCLLLQNIVLLMVGIYFVVLNFQLCALVKLFSVFIVTDGSKLDTSLYIVDGKKIFYEKKGMKKSMDSYITVPVFIMLV